MDLNQQLVLRVPPGCALQEHDGDAASGELFEQQHLVGVAPRKSVRAVDIQHIDRPLSDAVAKPLQCRPDQRRAAAPIVDVQVCRQDVMTIGESSLLQSRHLAVDRGVLGLPIRRNTRVQRNLLHTAFPPLQRGRCAAAGSRLCGASTSERTSRRVGGTTMA
ncbi:hypothetical protein WMF40_05940 [Sorangium sp. So ce854]